MDLTRSGALVILCSLPAYCCRPNYEPSDVPGVCVEKAIDVATNAQWVSDERPPQSGMPSWQATGIKLIDAPELTAQDTKADLDNADADRVGKRKAGIR